MGDSSTCLMQPLGDSSACLMQPFSYTSVPPPTEAIEDNPIHVLGQSVSFGRFASESLSWEKWSTFSHKRYVEEAERYSRPGSVAEKKAFFEAHYKKMAEKKKAEAALLEQANATLVDAPGTDDVTDYCNSTSNPNVEKAVEQQVEARTQTSDLYPCFMLEKGESQCEEEDDKEPAKEQTTIQDVEKSPLMSSGPNTKEDSFATPKSVTSATNSSDKKRSAHRWLKPLNFTPVEELNILSSAVKRKIENSQVDGHHPRAAKDCPTPFKTPTTVPNVSSALATPQSERRKMKNDAGAESKTCTKRRSLATECSKFLNACKNKLQSPKISTPFRFRTEERAARRREKLEDKFNAEKAQNAPPKTKLKEIAETEPRKWRPTFCFTAGPLPSDRNEMRRAEDLMKKVPMAHAQPPKSGRRPETGTVPSTPLPSKTISTKTNGSKKFLGKTFQTASQPRAAENVMRARENTSPNIQQV